MPKDHRCRERRLIDIGDLADVPMYERCVLARGHEVPLTGVYAEALHFYQADLNKARAKSGIGFTPFATDTIIELEGDDDRIWTRRADGDWDLHSTRAGRGVVAGVQIITLDHEVLDQFRDRVFHLKVVGSRLPDEDWPDPMDDFGPDQDRPNFAPGASVLLRHERFAHPITGIVVRVHGDTVTFDEDFGGGRGTYPASNFEAWEPDEGTARWRGGQEAGPVEAKVGPRCQVTDRFRSEGQRQCVLEDGHIADPARRKHVFAGNRVGVTFPSRPDGLIGMGTRSAEPYRLCHVDVDDGTRVVKVDLDEDVLINAGDQWSVAFDDPILCVVVNHDDRFTIHTQRVG